MTQTMAQCIDRSAKRDFRRDGLIFDFNPGLPQLFPNINVLLKIASKLPVTSCECEISINFVWLNPYTTAVQTRWIEMKAYFTFVTHD